MSEWEEIRPKFERVLFRRSVREVAEAIPACRQSVYNWASGRRRPNRAAQARIMEIVNDEHTD